MATLPSLMTPQTKQKTNNQRTTKAKETSSKTYPNTQEPHNFSPTKLTTPSSKRGNPRQGTPEGHRMKVTRRTTSFPDDESKDHTIKTNNYYQNKQQEIRSKHTQPKPPIIKQKIQVNGYDTYHLFLDTEY